MIVSLKYNNELIKLSTNQLKLIGSGLESHVYSYKNIAIKIYRKKTLKNRYGLTYESMNKLKNISTKRILLPINPIYSKTNCFSKLSFHGYSTKLVTEIKNKMYLTNIDTNHLYNELSILKDDSTMLSKNKVLIYDLDNEENFVFNGNLYFVDPGAYYFDNKLSLKEIYDENMEELSSALYNHIFCLNGNKERIMYELINMEGINIKNTNYRIIPLISEILVKYDDVNFIKSNIKYFIEYLMYILEKYESISKYKYKLLNDFVNDSNNKEKDITKIKKILK